MSFNNELYFCHFCRKIVDDLEELYFVDDTSCRGFCQEACIENFYRPIFKFYEKKEKKLRETFNCQQEKCRSLVQDIHLVERALKHPTHVYEVENKLGESLYAIHYRHKREQQNCWLISLCLISDGTVSFIMLITATENENLRKAFMIGEEVKDINQLLSPDVSLNVEKRENDHGADLTSFQNIEVSSETLEAAEQKKSELLAKLLENRLASDIPYESFHLYEDFTAETLENPDEIYKYTDSQGDELLTYLKAHEQSGIPFFYFVICLNLGDQYTEQGQALLPILSFPSLDGELSRIFRAGEKISGKLKN